MSEGTIPPNWKVLLQCRSQIGAPDNIYHKDTWFIPDLEEDSIKTPRHELIVAPENKINTPRSLTSKPHVHEGPSREEASESKLHKFLVSKVLNSTSKLG